ncbi:MAG TPA: hypothetical protein VF169_01065 [Albitalea sp.]|uniref:hypothetical protein n=1 Tax=Piscinibacter sp. TaxID=1903157 RepID=UPI002ED5AEE3
MNVIDLMAREHVRLSRELHQCTCAEDPWQALCLARGALGRTCAYLMAMQRCVFPALVAIGEVSAVPSVHYERVKSSAAEALLRSGRHDTSLVSALQALQRELDAYLRSEGRLMRTTLRRTLGERELRLLGGELLMELAANRRPQPARASAKSGSMDVMKLLWACARAWLVRRREARLQALPILRQAVAQKALR